MGTGRRSGSATRKITVLTNDRDKERVQLVGTMNVLCAMKLEPTRVSFGHVPRDSGPQTRTVVITRGDGGPLNPVLVPLRKEGLAIELREIEPHERYELDITLSPPWPNEVMRGAVTLKTGVEKAPNEKINYSARVAPRLVASPARFTIPREVKTDMELTAKLKWSGNNPGTVLEATTTAPDTTATIEERDGQQVVVLHVPAGYSPGGRTLGFNVLLKTDDPQLRQMRIPINIMRRLSKARGEERRLNAARRPSQVKRARPVPIDVYPKRKPAARPSDEARDDQRSQKEEKKKSE